MSSTEYSYTLGNSVRFWEPDGLEQGPTVDDLVDRNVAFFDFQSGGHRFRVNIQAAGLLSKLLVEGGVEYEYVLPPSLTVIEGHLPDDWTDSRLNDSDTWVI